MLRAANDAPDAMSGPAARKSPAFSARPAGVKGICPTDIAEFFIAEDRGHDRRIRIGRIVELLEGRDDRVSGWLVGVLSHRARRLTPVEVDVDMGGST